MIYYLNRLKFDTPVHFGSSDSAQSLTSSEDHINADTLFSALCHMALQLYGTEGIEEFISYAVSGKFIISDTMPYCNGDYYIPKPYVISTEKKEISSVKRKALKKLKWIAVNSFADFTESVHGGEPYDTENTVTSFGRRLERTRAKVNDGTDAVPYQAGAYQFAENCGLYFIYAVENNDQADFINSLINALGMSGVGGLISSGFGKFHIEDRILLNESDDSQSRWLFDALNNTKNKNILIASSFPSDDELGDILDNACYQIIRRGGFISSENYSDLPQKKRDKYFFKGGSTFEKRFEGKVFEVGYNGNHKVYRYGKAMFLGVDL